jgi:predicted RNA-binding protein with PIN domain
VYDHKVPERRKSVVIIIVDGYNLIKTVGSNNFVEDKERTWYIKRLEKYSHQKKHNLLIIFDGGMSNWSTKQLAARATVIYAGFGKSADDCIMAYIDQYVGKDLLLVSSDTALQAYADGKNVVSIGAEDFWFLVRSALATEVAAQDSHEGGARSVKTGENTDQELDELLMGTSMRHEFVKSDYEVSDFADRRQKSSTKQARRLERIIKKL